MEAQVFRKTLQNLTAPVISGLLGFLRPEDQRRPLQGCTKTKTKFIEVGGAAKRESVTELENFLKTFEPITEKAIGNYL